jgi:hypothetical protein
MIVPETPLKKTPQWTVFLMAIIVVVVFGIFLLPKGWKSEPQSFVVENNVETYPSEMPKELILDLQKFTSATWTTQPGGLRVFAASYITPNAIDKISNSYKSRLESAGWSVSIDSGEKNTVLKTENSGQEAKYTLSQINENSTNVQLEYFKK